LKENHNKKSKTFLTNELDEENSNFSSSGVDFLWKKMNGNMSMTLSMPKNSSTTSNLDRSHIVTLERGGGNCQGIDSLTRPVTFLAISS
jgi:hypothetical protein